MSLFLLLVGLANFVTAAATNSTSNAIIGVVCIVIAMIDAKSNGGEDA